VGGGGERGIQERIPSVFKESRRFMRVSLVVKQLLWSTTIWRLEVGGCRLGVGSWRLKVGGWRLEVGGLSLEFGGWRLEVGGWRLALEVGGWR
jgi:hypothetical protein